MRALELSRISRFVVAVAALILWPFFAWNTLKWVGDVTVGVVLRWINDETIPQEFYAATQPFQLLINYFSTPSVWGFLLLFIISGLLQDQNNKKNQRKDFIF